MQTTVMNVPLLEGLNRVNRQLSKKDISYHQLSKIPKVQIDGNRQNFQDPSIFHFSVSRVIVMVYWLLVNPGPDWKTSSHALF